MKPNLTGVWKLDIARSDFGFLSPAVSRVDEIDHAGDLLCIRTTQVDANGRTQVERRMTIGGDPVTVDIRGRMRTIRAWWDGGEVVIETGSDVSGQARRIVDRWAMQETGDSVVVTRRHEMPGGAVQQRLVFYAGLRLTGLG